MTNALNKMGWLLAALVSLVAMAALEAWIAAQASAPAPEGEAGRRSQ